MDNVIIFTHKFCLVKRKYILPLFLIIQIIFIQIISFFPEAVERFYTNGWYAFLSKIERGLFGKIPFSMGDVLYGGLIVCLMYSFWQFKNRWKADRKNFLLRLLS